MKVNSEVENDNEKLTKGYVIFDPNDYGLYEFMHSIEDKKD